MTTPYSPYAVTSPTVRVGDHDRQAIAALLGLALSQGYLELGEYDSRLQTAFSAQTVAELRQLTADLPVATLRRNDPQRAAARQRAIRRGVQWHLAGYLVMVVIVLTVWLAVGLSAGAWYFWPIWPILGAGLGLVAHALPTRHRMFSPCSVRRLMP